MMGVNQLIQAATTWALGRRTDHNAEAAGQRESEDLHNTHAGFAATEGEDSGAAGFEAGAGKDVKLTTDGGVVKKVLNKGDRRQTPKDGDEVSVHYTGTLLDGTKFDSSRDCNEPFKFKLGTGLGIKGFDMGVRTMTLGEKAVLTCKPEYALGNTGLPPTIPGNATLRFEVELLGWGSGEDVTGDGGIIKTIVAEGCGHQMPKDGDNVSVRYKLWVDGSEVSVSESPAEGMYFTVGDKNLHAFSVAVKTMKKGERAQLTVKPQYGFVREGSAELGVPPNVALRVDLELMEVYTVELVAPDGGVTKKTLSKSTDSLKPHPKGASVSLVYTMTWVVMANGTVVQQGAEDGKMEFATGEDTTERAEQGLELAILTMTKGEVAFINIAPHCPARSSHAPAWEAVSTPWFDESDSFVPPDADIIYTVQLTGFTNPDGGEEMKDDERLKAATFETDVGNANFKAGSFQVAAECYKAACELLDNDVEWGPSLRGNLQEVNMAAWLNRAAVALKLQDTEGAIAACNKVLKMDPVNIMGLHRRAQAYLRRGNFIEALADVNKAVTEEPQNMDVRRLQDQLRVQSLAASHKEATLNGSIFAKLANKDRQ